MVSQRLVRLPAGSVAGAIEWPTPSKLPIGPLLNYGYEGTLLLPVLFVFCLPFFLAAFWASSSSR